MKSLATMLLACGLAACATLPAGTPPVATFSIVAFDPDTGDVGVAVQSKFFGVGSVVPWVRADVGAIATQAWANTTWGPDGLALLEKGLAPAAVLEVLTARDAGRERRQAGIVDVQGRSASFTGDGAMTWAGHVTGEGYACQGNILAGEEVVAEMARAFEETDAPLPERLVAALRAGQAAGGDKRGRQSAALLVARRGGGYSGFNDRYVDLRVEDHETPIEELARLLGLHREFFPNVPLPGDRGGFAPEEETAALWSEWVRLFRARDYTALHALYTAAYRTEHSAEEFAKEMTGSEEGIDAFLETAVYAGTKIEGDRARIALTRPGGPRPVYLSLVREAAGWRFAD